MAIGKWQFVIRNWQKPRVGLLRVLERSVRYATAKKISRFAQELRFGGRQENAWWLMIMT
jgi:hypothetical protein